MKTQYMPRGSDLVASAFRRLDREIAILHRQIALSSLFSWNYAGRGDWLAKRSGSGDLADLESWAPGRSRALVAPDPVERKRHRWELVLAAVVACLALCACKPEDSSPKAPEISDPFRPPPELRPRVRGLHVFPSKGAGPEEVVLLLEVPQ